jgi:hypothetical protein
MLFCSFLFCFYVELCRGRGKEEKRIGEEVCFCGRKDRSLSRDAVVVHSMRMILVSVVKLLISGLYALRVMLNSFVVRY